MHQTSATRGGDLLTCTSHQNYCQSVVTNVIVVCKTKRLLTEQWVLVGRVYYPATRQRANLIQIDHCLLFYPAESAYVCVLMMMVCWVLGTRLGDVDWIWLACALSALGFNYGDNGIRLLVRLYHRITARRLPKTYLAIYTPFVHPLADYGYRPLAGLAASIIYSFVALLAPPRRPPPLPPFPLPLTRVRSIMSVSIDIVPLTETVDMYGMPDTL
jgi:hypothetical protein